MFIGPFRAYDSETLRKADWDEFTTRLSAMTSHWLESNKSSKNSNIGCRGNTGCDLQDSPPPEPESEPEPGAKAAELEARTLALVQDFPHLVRDFDRFVQCARMTAMRYGR
ncbi:hypothetical protein Trco_005292 [Trichoderma cornu-damae]|uniref:Uncharacterized protein n=1 Tax=Trichoderma cornu-damae TaxID=654480 RepID=A0A9P8TV31_9HYPO|nr:hypothetical protein Trco_005292 [Trichoderma cornu-damae]